MIDRTHIPGMVFFVFFLAVLALMVLMARPMLGAIIFGAIFSGTFYPFHLWVAKKLDWSAEKTAPVSCLAIAMFLFLPLCYLIYKLSLETFAVYEFVKGFMNPEAISNLIENNKISQAVVAQLAKVGIEFDLALIKDTSLKGLQSFSKVFLSGLNAGLINIFGFAWDFLLMLLVMFAFFKEGPRLKAYVFELSPLPNEYEQRILETFNQMNYVTLVCNGVGGVIQGVLAGMAFWIAGFPSIVFWSFVMVLLAFIPLAGISLVYIPACIYLYLSGSTVTAIVLFLYCTAVALIVENWFKPQFIGNRIQINSLFVLFTIIGGMGVFGMAGVFYGPVLGIIFLTTVEIYHESYAPESSLSPLDLAARGGVLKNRARDVQRVRILDPASRP